MHCMYCSFRSSNLPSTYCSKPAAWRTTFFNRIITAFPALTSPNLIGLSPDCLSHGIKLYAMNNSRDSVFLISSKQSFNKDCKLLHNSDDAVPNERDVKIFFQLSTSRPDAPDLPFVSITAFKMKDSSISPYIIGWTGCVGPCNNTCWGGLLASGCFCYYFFKFSSVKGKIPFDMFSVKSLSTRLTFPCSSYFWTWKRFFQWSYHFHCSSFFSELSPLHVINC